MLPPTMPATASPARGLGMPTQPNRDDIDHTWNYLEDGISQIMLNLQSGMTMATVLDLLPLSIHLPLSKD